MAGTTSSRLHQKADAGMKGRPNDRSLRSAPARVDPVLFFDPQPCTTAMQGLLPSVNNTQLGSR